MVPLEGAQDLLGPLAPHYWSEVIAGILLVFAVLVLLYRRFLAPQRGPA